MDTIDDDIIDGMYLNICSMYLTLMKRKKQKRKLRRKDGKRRKRRWKTRPINQNKDESGFYKQFLRMKETNSPELFESFRMSTKLFDSLFGLTRKFLVKRKNQIFAEERLSITLMYLANGESMNIIGARYKVGSTTVRKIVYETCEVLWQVLSPIYLPELTASDYINIADGFWDLTEMPNCVGAVDRKEINLRVFPQRVLSNIFSMGLTAACDARLQFTHVSVDRYKNENDANSLQNSDLGQLILLKNLPLPPDLALPNAPGKTFPHYFVTDVSFPLTKNLMRPFRARTPSDKEKCFNERILRAASTIDNALGVLEARWRVLNRTLECNEETAEIIVLACVVLHNFIMASDTEDLYCPPNFTDDFSEGGSRKGDWRLEFKRNKDRLQTLSTRSRNASSAAFGLRDALAEYLYETRQAFH